MNIKKEYIVLVAIICGLSLYLILRNPDRTHYQLPKFPETAATDVSRIEISTRDTSLLLDKKDNKWHLAPDGYLADTDMVRSMLDTIEELTLTALVSESKNYSRYHLDNNNKITVKAWKGRMLSREFEVGKVAESYQHTFVKLAGDDRVYHARGNFRSRFDQTVDNLRDKTVLSFDQGEIQEIQIKKGKEAIAFSRTAVPHEVTVGQEAGAERPLSPEVETIWQTADGKEGDEGQMERLLSALSNLKCEKYIDDQKKEDFSNPIYRIHLKSTQEHTLSVFAKANEDAKSYPAISSGNNYPFMLPDWQVNNLMKEPAEMLKKEKPSADSSLATSSPFLA